MLLPPGDDASTFVVTADLDRNSFDWLDGLRREHFPPARNLLPAHLTLFHKLDAASVVLVRDIVGSPLPGTIALHFTNLRRLGRGVAVDVSSQKLIALHSACAAALDGRLTVQDRQPFRPHVTIQNKVEPAVAHLLFMALQSRFATRDGDSQALLVWRYRGGPWELSERLSFSA